MMAIAAGALAAAMLPGVASAKANPDSAAGACGQEIALGITDVAVGKLFIPGYPETVDDDHSLGEMIQSQHSLGAFSIYSDCVPGFASQDQ